MTTNELERLKALRDRPRTPVNYTLYWNTPAGNDAEYRDALVNADPLAEIERLQQRWMRLCGMVFAGEATIKDIQLVREYMQELEAHDA